MPVSNDILEKLGLANDDAKTPTEDAVFGISSDVEQIPTSDTVIAHDGFGRSRGPILLDESSKVRESFKKASIEGFKAENAASDLFAVCYDPSPKFTKNPEDKARQHFIEGLMASNDMHELRSVTAGSILGATVASAELAERYSEYVVDIGEDQRKRKRGKGNADKKSPMEQQIAGMKCAAGAAKKAKDAVNDAMDAAEGLGLGDGNSGVASVDRIQNVLKKVKKSDTLRKVCEQAGRWRRLAAGKQRQKTRHGYDDMVGIELSGDAGRLIPSELCALADPILGLDAERRLVEKTMLSREYHGSEKTGKGPIVVVVDESGSMSGDPIINAKAFALTMAWIARRQKRWCTLAGFSGGREMNYICLPPGKWDEVALMAWVEHFYSGGTSLDVPLVEVPAKWPEMISSGMKRGKTDLIVVTDGIVRCPQEMSESFLKFKNDEKVKMTTIGIGVHDVGDLKPLSDTVTCVPNLVPVDGEVANVLSV